MLKQREARWLALCAAMTGTACLVSTDPVGQGGAPAQGQGGSGQGGASGSPAQAGSSGASQGGNAGETNGGSAGSSAGSAGSAGDSSNGGTGGGGTGAPCPPDDGTAAALTLAGLGLELPEQLTEVDAGAADGGAGGPLEFEGLALPELLGWATQPGLGTATTIGGAAGQIVTADTAAELIDFASRPEPLVIRVCGTLAAPELRVSSHKTLLGVGPGATIEGGILVGGDADYARNVVIKNLRVNAATSDVLGEAIRVERAHHVWIDHSEILDASGDGAVDIVNGSDLITISWSKFHFTPNTPDIEHRFGCRIGDHNQDEALSQAQDPGHLNVTLHHVWFADDVRQRAPRVRFGNVHVFNSYYSIGTLPNDYSVWASTTSKVLLQNNYFKQVHNPHELNAPDAQLLSIGNVYDGATGLMQGTGSAFAPPYAYTLESALDIPELVTEGAGPR